MLNAVSTSVVANIFLHMRLCIIRRKCLPFDWQFSKKSSPKREKQSLHCTVSNQLVRRVHLAGMLYLYLLFSKVLSVACLEAMWKGIIKAILIFKIEFAYLISLPESFYLALNSSNTCKVFPLWTSACLETSSGWKAVCGRGIILQDNEENALMNRAWWQQCGGLYWSISEERQHMWQDFKGALHPPSNSLAIQVFCAKHSPQWSREDRTGLGAWLGRKKKETLYQDVLHGFKCLVCKKQVIECR